MIWAQEHEDILRDQVEEDVYQSRYKKDDMSSKE
jgi:hypothetical protein